MVDGIRGWADRQKCPVTVLLIGSLLAVTVIFFLTSNEGIKSAMLSPDSQVRPWSFLTYPWAYMPLNEAVGIVSLVFLLMWLYSMGGQIELDMGSARYAVFWFVMTLLGGVLFWIGYRVANVAQNYPEPALYGGPFIPEAAVTMAWCARYPARTIMLYGVLPVRGQWLAVLTFAMVLVLHGNPVPILGVMAAIPLAVAYFWALERIPKVGFVDHVAKSRRKEDAPATRAQVRYDERYYEDVKRREKEREEQERLKKLLGE